MLQIVNVCLCRQRNVCNVYLLYTLSFHYVCYLSVLQMYLCGQMSESLSGFSPLTSKTLQTTSLSQAYMAH